MNPCERSWAEGNRYSAMTLCPFSVAKGQIGKMLLKSLKMLKYKQFTHIIIESLIDFLVEKSPMEGTYWECIAIN
jgi:hypothetical protein